MLTNLARLAASPAAPGLVLGAAALAALGVANSPLAGGYDAFVHLRGELRIGDALVLAKPLVVWVNDLWMAVFFFLVGLEIKREVVEGDLASPRQAALPIAAALGGMVVPALIYAAINRGDGVALRGWAIPSATDIAFTLGVLALLGARVPASLKLFVTAVAIIDDLGAIVIIALFYTADLSASMLGAAGLGIAMLAALNRARVGSIGPYVVVGLLVWLCVLKSGVHATLAGVVTALAVPVHGHYGDTPLARAEHALKPWVDFAILPAFAFVNAGVSLAGVSFASFAEPVALGIGAGLVAGKAAGVFGAAWLMARFAGARLPSGASLLQFFAVCVLCGIGFTMSLFIGSLAFDGQPGDWETQVKLGVLGGSLVSALIGTALLIAPRGGISGSRLRAGDERRRPPRQSLRRSRRVRRSRTCRRG